MSESKYIHKSHNVSVLLYHFVCPAKYRKVVFSKDVDETLMNVCLEIEKRYDVHFLEIGTGWLNYFKLADMKRLLTEIDFWLRRRLRMVIWKQWKRVRTRIRNLKKLGIEEERAVKTALTRKGYWRMAHCRTLDTAISTNRLCRAGYIFFSDYYRQCRPCQ